jgi:type IV pilus assembly protein PilX
MSHFTPPAAKSQRGMTLIAALLLLVVITILGVGMLHSFGIQERVAGNTLQKQRGLRAAEAALVHYEQVLTQNMGANANTGITCAAGTVTNGTVQVCSNTLATSSTANSTTPLNIGGAEADMVYTTYTPAALASSPSAPYQSPRAYISFITGTYNQTTGQSTNTYIVDAVGWGGTANSIAEVESTYLVNVIYTTQTAASDSKFVNLGGP